MSALSLSPSSAAWTESVMNGANALCVCFACFVSLFRADSRSVREFSGRESEEEEEFDEDNEEYDEYDDDDWFICDCVEE